MDGCPGVVKFLSIYMDMYMNIYLGIDIDAHLSSLGGESMTLEALNPVFGTSKKFIYQGEFLLFY